MAKQICENLSAFNCALPTVYYPLLVVHIFWIFNLQSSIFNLLYPGISNSAHRLMVSDIS